MHVPRAPNECGWQDHQPASLVGVCISITQGILHALVQICTQLGLIAADPAQALTFHLAPLIHQPLLVEPLAVHKEGLALWLPVMHEISSIVHGSDLSFSPPSATSTPLLCIPTLLPYLLLPTRPLSSTIIKQCAHTLSPTPPAGGRRLLHDVWVPSILTPWMEQNKMEGVICGMAVTHEAERVAYTLPCLHTDTPPLPGLITWHETCNLISALTGRQVVAPPVNSSINLNHYLTVMQLSLWHVHDLPKLPNVSVAPYQSTLQLAQHFCVQGRVALAQSGNALLQLLCMAINDVQLSKLGFFGCVGQQWPQQVMDGPSDGNHADALPGGCHMDARRSHLQGRVVGPDVLTKLLGRWWQVGAGQQGLDGLRGWLHEEAGQCQVLATAATRGGSRGWGRGGGGEGWGRGGGGEGVRQGVDHNLKIPHAAVPCTPECMQQVQAQQKSTPSGKTTCL